MPDVAAARAFDPAAVPAALTAGGALVERIEDSALSSTQPAQQQFHDGWLLRHSPGKARRARSVNTLAPGRLPLSEKLAYCEAFYARHALPCIHRVTPFRAPDGFDAALAARGYMAGGDTRVMALDLARSAAVALPAVHVQRLDVAAYSAAYAQLHGLSATKAAAEAERFARNAASTLYMAVGDAGGTLACGSATLDGTLVGVFGMVTAEAQRGRGLARALVAALLADARAAGATTAYLQVESDNDPARSVYRKFGFSDCYAYWYRGQSGVAESST